MFLRFDNLLKTPYPTEMLDTGLFALFDRRTSAFIVKL